MAVERYYLLINFYIFYNNTMERELFTVILCILLIGLVMNIYYRYEEGFNDSINDTPLQSSGTTNVGLSGYDLLSTVSQCGSHQNLVCSCKRGNESDDITFVEQGIITDNPSNIFTYEQFIEEINSGSGSSIEPMANASYTTHDDRLNQINAEQEIISIIGTKDTNNEYSVKVVEGDYSNFWNDEGVVIPVSEAITNHTSSHILNQEVLWYVGPSKEDLMNRVNGGLRQEKVDFLRREGYLMDGELVDGGNFPLTIYDFPEVEIIWNNTMEYFLDMFKPPSENQNWEGLSVSERRGAEALEWDEGSWNAELNGELGGQYEAPESESKAWNELEGGEEDEHESNYPKNSKAAAIVLGWKKYTWDKDIYDLFTDYLIEYNESKNNELYEDTLENRKEMGRFHGIYAPCNNLINVNSSTAGEWEGGSRKICENIINESGYFGDKRAPNCADNCEGCYAQYSNGRKFMCRYYNGGNSRRVCEKGDRCDDETYISNGGYITTKIISVLQNKYLSDNVQEHVRFSFPDQSILKDKLREKINNNSEYINYLKLLEAVQEEDWLLFFTYRKLGSVGDHFYVNIGSNRPNEEVCEDKEGIVATKDVVDGSGEVIDSQDLTCVEAETWCADNSELEAMCKQTCGLCPTEQTDGDEQVKDLYYLVVLSKNTVNKYSNQLQLLKKTIRQTLYAFLNNINPVYKVQLVEGGSVTNKWNKTSYNRLDIANLFPSNNNWHEEEINKGNPDNYEYVNEISGWEEYTSREGNANLAGMASSRGRAIVHAYSILCPLDEHRDAHGESVEANDGWMGVREGGSRRTRFNVQASASVLIHELAHRIHQLIKNNTPLGEKIIKTFHTYQKEDRTLYLSESHPDVHWKGCTNCQALAELAKPACSFTPGTVGNPSTNCPADCTLAGTAGTDETCIKTEADGVRDCKGHEPIEPVNDRTSRNPYSCYEYREFFAVATECWHGVGQDYQKYTETMLESLATDLLPSETLDMVGISRDTGYERIALYPPTLMKNFVINTKENGITVSETLYDVMESIWGPPKNLCSEKYGVDNLMPGGSDSSLRIREEGQCYKPQCNISYGGGFEGIQTGIIDSVEGSATILTSGLVGAAGISAGAFSAAR
jgi:hypothetical protein